MMVSIEMQMMVNPLLEIHMAVDPLLEIQMLYKRFVKWSILNLSEMRMVGILYWTFKTVNNPLLDMSIVLNPLLDM